MNFLVFLDPWAGELEKILSGVKSMLLKEFDPSQSAGQPVRPGDGLYFLRSTDEGVLRVKATVLRVLPFTNHLDEDLSHILKELQPRLQLTEDQYNYWSTKEYVLMVEFVSAHKIGVVHVTSNKILDRSGWIAFEAISEIAEQCEAKDRKHD